MGAAETFGGLREDSVNHTVEIVDHLAVPEPDDGPSFANEKGRSTLIIVFSVEMLRAVELHCQLR